MVQQRLGYVIFYLVILLINIHNVKPLSLNLPENPKDLLGHLIDNEGNAPVVIVVDTNQHQKSSDEELISNKEDILLANDGVENEAYEEAKYLLYHILRRSNQDDNLDSSLEETNETLHQALRARCLQVNKCIKKCPKKKTLCSKNCREVFDNLNLCKSKQLNCGSKCGEGLPTFLEKFKKLIMYLKNKISE